MLGMARLMDLTRVDLIIQCALAVAGEQEWDERELGPIHLVKYVYLADLAFSQKHGGESYTGAPWRFYHFGPWAESVLDRLEPAALAINAERRVFSSPRYDGDVVRYSVSQDRRLVDRITAGLPHEISGALRRYVREYGRDTEGLLRFVYATPPMLRAAPNERLVFEDVPEVKVLEPEAEQTKPSVKARRARRERMERLRDEVRRRLDDKRSRRATPAGPAPRYDDVFFEGFRWLDGLAGESMRAVDLEVSFSDDVWKSASRRGTEVS